MRRKIIIGLSLLVGCLVLGISLTGIILEDGGEPHTVTSIRGETVIIYGGNGLYKYDTPQKAYVGRAYDWMNLLFALPMLAGGIILYVRKKLLGTILLLGGYSHFFYNYLLGVMGMALNLLFLAYIALYSAGMFGGALLLSERATGEIGTRLINKKIRIPMAVTLLVLGGVFLAFWLALALKATAAGNTSPLLGTYTTLDTQALDLGVFVPVTIVGALLFLMKRKWGAVISVIMSFALLETFISLSLSVILVVLHTGETVNIIPLLFTALLGSQCLVVIFQIGKEKTVS